MANGDAFADAVQMAKRTPTLDVGCHLVLVQSNSVLTGRPLPETPRDLLVALARRQLNVYAELRAQIEKIVASGIRPTHLDSHKHTHIVPTIFRAVVRLADEFEIPYVRLPLAGRYYRRMARGLNVRMTDHFLGFRLTGRLDEQSFARALANLPEGTTEFMCHPGFLGDELRHAKTRLKEARVKELEALTSPKAREVISERKILLARWRGL